MSKIVFSGVGHGGNDNGAVANGLREDDMNLVEALACNEILVAHGVKNPMSRYKDEADPIDEEVREANASGAVIAVDFHNNAGGGDGFEAYYSIGDAEGLKLCKFIEEEVVKLGQNSRGCKTKVGYGGKDYFAFIRDTKMTAIILEGAFLDSEDRKFKDTKEEQRAYGVAVAKGILRYLGIQYKGDTNTINKPKPSKPSTSNPKPSTWDDSVKGKIGVVTGTGVNVRLDGNMNGKILGTVNKGQKLTLYRLEGDWYHCYSIYNGYNRCYVHKDYIKVQTTVIQEGTAYCTVKSLNVRNGASTDYSIQGELNLMERVAIIGRAGNWRQVRYYNAPAKCNKIGWVSSAYLRITKDI